MDHELSAEGPLLHGVVFFVGNRFQPNSFSLLSRCDRNVGKGTIGRCSVPVLYTRRAFDHISLMDDLYRLSLFLVIAYAFSDEQHLASRMDMPIQLCTGTINCLSDTGVEGTVSNVELTKPDIPRMIFCAGQ